MSPSATSLAGNRHSFSGGCGCEGGGGGGGGGFTSPEARADAGIMSCSSLTPDEDCHLRWKRLKIFGVLLSLVEGTGLLDPEWTGGEREEGEGGGERERGQGRERRER